MASNRFLIFFHDGTSIERTIIEADTEDEAREAFADSNPDDRIVKIFGSTEY